VTEREISQWGDLLAVYGGNYERAATAWRDAGMGEPPTGRARMEAEDEDAVQWAIRKALRERGALVWHADAGSKEQTRKAKAGRPPAGWPDLQVFLPAGRHVLLEVKRPGGKLSGDQVRMHDTLRRMGHEVFTVSSAEEAVAFVFSTAEVTEVAA
jgi:CheY-like chemotaxis protein